MVSNNFPNAPECVKLNLIAFHQASLLTAVEETVAARLARTVRFTCVIVVFFVTLVEALFAVFKRAEVSFLYARLILRTSNSQFLFDFWEMHQDHRQCSHCNDHQQHFRFQKTRRRTAHSRLCASSRSDFACETRKPLPCPVTHISHAGLESLPASHYSPPNLAGSMLCTLVFIWLKFNQM